MAAPRKNKNSKAIQKKDSSVLERKYKGKLYQDESPWMICNFRSFAYDLSDDDKVMHLADIVYKEEIGKPKPKKVATVHYEYDSLKEISKPFKNARLIMSAPLLYNELNELRNLMLEGKLPKKNITRINQLIMQIHS